MTTLEGLIVRPIRDGDAEAIGEALRELGTPEHTERGLERQHGGLGVFLIAWLNGEAVGYITAHWRASPRSPDEWKDGFTAYLEDLIVAEQQRGRGIGGAIMETAEKMAQERGLVRVTLGVGVENEGARRLYERLGYKDAGLETVEDRGSFQRWDGEMVEWQETWRFMVKDLER
jgi:ribosomal protein S18 acetylase RimI-like enzyme